MNIYLVALIVLVSIYFGFKILKALFIFGGLLYESTCEVLEERRKDRRCY